MGSYNLEIISQQIVERIEEILNDFGIHCDYNNDYISMPCPIHGGNNPNGLSILLKDVGNWTCFTQGCHEEYDSSILGFLEGLLSTQYNRKINRREAIEWAARFTGIESESKYIKRVDTDFIHLFKYIHKDKKYTNNFIPRDVLRSSLEIPAKYFLDRYSRAVLIDYDIGLCINSQEPMYNRVVVPLYDDTGNFMVGCIGRSIFNQCIQCERYHDPNVRCSIGSKERIKTPKWKFSSKFDADIYLYNFWKAKDYIREDKVAVLVEGTGDVWKLEESGIHYGLALLGTKFTDCQCETLEETGILHLIISTDNDQAGQKSRKMIEQRCKRLFNIHHVYTETDVGDLTIDQTKELFDSTLKYVKERTLNE